MNIRDYASQFADFTKNRAPCPIHKGEANSFAVYPKTNKFKCFSCGKSGTLAYLICLMEGVPAHVAKKRVDSDWKPDPALQEAAEYGATQAKLKKLIVIELGFADYLEPDELARVGKLLEQVDDAVFVWETLATFPQDIPYDHRPMCVRHGIDADWFAAAGPHEMIWVTFRWEELNKTIRKGDKK